VVIGDDHDRVRPRGVEMRLHLAKQPRGLVRGVLGDLGRVMGRVGDTRVRVPLGVDAVPPLMGARVVVSTDQFVEVE